LIVTALLAMLLAVILQLLLVRAWRHLVNRRYYRSIWRVTPDHTSAGPRPDEAIESRPLENPLKKPPKFYPFPKSLVWPTPLLFSSCVFITGLTRASVRVLAMAAATAAPGQSLWSTVVSGGPGPAAPSPPLPRCQSSASSSYSRRSTLLSSFGGTADGCSGSPVDALPTPARSSIH
jgi:hypothetical protein